MNFFKSRAKEAERAVRPLNEVVPVERFPDMSEAQVCRALAVEDDNEVLRAVVCVLRDRRYQAVNDVAMAKIEDTVKAAGVLYGVQASEQAVLTAVHHSRESMLARRKAHDPKA